MSQTKAQLIEGLNINTSAPADALVIDSSGRVGIGDSSPSNKLVVKDGGSPTIEINGQGRAASLTLGVTASESKLFEGSNNALAFGTNNTERMRIDSSGNVIIGTTTAASNSQLTIRNASAQLALYSTPGGLSALNMGDTDDHDDGQIAYDNSSGFLKFVTRASEVMRLDSSGRVGIGTSSPESNAQATIYEDSGNTPLYLKANNANSYLYFEDSGTSSFKVAVGSSSNNLKFITNGSERMRIDSSGIVGIGTTSPTSYANSQATLVIEDDTNPAICWSDTGQTRDWWAVANGSNLSFNYADGGGSGSASNITNALSMTNSGNVGIGTTSPGDQLHIHTASSGAANVRFSSTDVPNGFFVGFDGQERGQIWHTANNDIRIATNNSERMVVKSGGLVGIGTSAPDQLLTLGSTGDTQLKLTTSNSTAHSRINFTNSGSSASGGLWYGSGNTMEFRTNDTERMRIESNGFVKAKAGYLYVQTSGSGTGNTDGLALIVDGNTDAYVWNYENTTLRFGTNNVERMRLDASGNLHIGTTSGITQSAELRVAGSGVATAEFYNAGGCYNTWSSGGTPTARGFIGVANQLISGGSGSNFAIRAQSSMNFATGGDAMRLTIDSNGTFTNKSSNVGSIAGEGFTLGRQADSYLIVTRDNDNPVFINRLTSDGDLIRFYGQGNQEGNIAVSGSTVSYLGGHLSRWSQLAGNAERTEILRGTVLSNLDEMCEWAHAAQDAVLYTEEDELPEGVSVGDVKTPAVDAYLEDNEQLNRMKVSDVEGDVNVAGIFQAWDDDDDTFTNDLVCAMTGDFVIRIAQGTTVARGDLLMSAGDGTAKPQDDDIVRSKTIAKVTSTTVSTTYSDGSYCVPCVLMAC